MFPNSTTPFTQQTMHVNHCNKTQRKVNKRSIQEKEINLHLTSSVFEFPKDSIHPVSVETEGPECLVQLGTHLVQSKNRILTTPLNAPYRVSKIKPPKTLIPWFPTLATPVRASSCLLPSQPRSQLYWRSHGGKQQTIQPHTHSPTKALNQKPI